MEERAEKAASGGDGKSFASDLNTNNERNNIFFHENATKSKIIYDYRVLCL